MNIDKDGLAAAARALYALEHSCQAPEDMSPPYSPKSKIGLAIGGAEAAITAYLSALPDTGDELVARLRRAVIDGMDWAGTMPAKDAVKVRPKDWHAICDTAREASDAIASLTARAQAAEASLASAREALEPLEARAEKWNLNTDQARVSVPLRELRAIVRALKEVR